MKVGFVGLGQMGSAMAANLVKAGHEVTVWNRSADKAKPLVDAGATLAASPAEAGLGDLVLSMLADDRAVEAVVFGEGGLATAPALHVSHSTISIALAKRLAEAQAGRFVAAPVFGRPDAAAAAKLFVVAAGPPELIERCTEAFDAIGQRTFHLGADATVANLVKLCGNYLIMSAVEGMAEAMALAEKGGVERGALLEILTETLFGAPIYRNYGQMLVEDRFRPAGFAAPLGLKDMTLVAAAATETRVPMPVLGVVRDHLLQAIAQEGEDVDWSAVGLAVRRNAGLGS